MKCQHNRLLAKSSFLPVVGFYLLIALEFFYMASPFAMYLYAAYLPGLESLRRIPELAWLTDFFLPHYAATSSVLINLSKPVGVGLTVLGLLGFLWGAVQIYARKLQKKGVASQSIYRFIRHPQYAALIVASVGTLLIWPRFLILFFFFIMLVVYHLLAALEERECQEKYGDAYRAYAQRTPRFLPIRLAPIEGFSRRFRIVATVALFISWAALSVMSAFQAQQRTVDHLFAYSDDDSIFISVHEQDIDALDRLAVNVLRDPRVDERLSSHSAPGDFYLNYVLPQSWMVGEIPMNGEKTHYSPADFDRDALKVVITKATSRGGGSGVGMDRLRHVSFIEPLLEVRVNRFGHVNEILDSPKDRFFGAVPVPLF